MRAMTADLVGAAVLVALLGGVAQALPSGTMSPAFWAGSWAIATLVAVLLALPAIGPVRSRDWLWLAGGSVWFAAIFFGANRGLDALHGPRPSPLDTGGSLGGFELWYALCPGLTSIALAGWVRSLLRRSNR